MVKVKVSKIIPQDEKDFISLMKEKQILILEKEDRGYVCIFNLKAEEAEIEEIMVYSSLSWAFD